MPNPEVDRQFSRLLSQPQPISERAPSSLKARLYSALVQHQEESGPLASLDASAAAGRALCVFEKLVQIAPVGEKLKSPFYCRVCHARALAERFDNAPIFWPHCPYVEFKS
jgi:hypothetical protein